MPEATLRPISDVEQGWQDSTGGAQGTLHLLVDSLDRGDAIPDEWDEIGTEPYLHTGSTDDRIETKTDLEQHGYFTYQNSGKTTENMGTVKCVVSLSSDGDDGVHVWIHDGTSEHQLTDPATTGIHGGADPDYADEYLDWCYTHNQALNACLNTWAKIDNAKVRFQYNKYQKANWIRIIYSELEVKWSTPRTDYTEVDEDPHDGDTTCLTTSGYSANWEDDLFTFESFSLPEDNKIDYVRVYGTARSVNDLYRGYFARLIRPTTTKYASYASSPPETYTEYYTQWDTNPETGQPWTEAEINALAAGVRGKSYENCILKCAGYVYYGVKCTQCYIVVGYSPEVAKTQYSNGLTCVSVG